MSQYNEPWKVEHVRLPAIARYRTIHDANGKEVTQASEISYGGESDEREQIPCIDDELLERIVLCVNACQGLTNEELTDAAEFRHARRECDHRFKLCEVFDWGQEAMVCETCQLVQIRIVK